MSNLTMSDPNALAAMGIPGATTLETAASAAAAQAQAAVQARYIVALHRPRNLDDVRQRMLKECRRSTFAEVARYHKPIGKGVEGPSIRFAEVAVRLMTNILVETPTLYDDTTKRIVRVTVMDLEANATYSRDVTIAKTVERKSLKPGQKPISQRVNSYGELTYTVEATDDDILNKENALVSKAIRTCALRLVPGDIVDECMEEVKRTIAAGIQQDPDGERKRLVDSFARLNVEPSALEGFLGCALGQATPEQLIRLRALWAGMRDGEITMADLQDAGVATEGQDKKKSGLEQKLSKQIAKIKKPKQTQKQTQPPETNAAAPRNQEQAPQGSAPEANEAFTGDPSQLTPEELAEQQALADAYDSDEGTSR